MSYYELWAILANWKRDFSGGEFARAFASPSPRKVLHDMAEKGLLERTERGRYRVRSIAEYAKMRNDVKAGYDLLAGVKMPYALTNVDAVFVRTRGGYNAGRFFGFYPIHLKVLKSDLPRWRRFFAEAGKKAVSARRRPKETLFGVFYFLYPENRLEAVALENLRVESLDKTLEFCRNNLHTFGPALEILTQRDLHPGSPRPRNEGRSQDFEQGLPRNR